MQTIVHTTWSCEDRKIVFIGGQIQAMSYIASYSELLLLKTNNTISSIPFYFSSLFPYMCFLNFWAISYLTLTNMPLFHLHATLSYISLEMKYFQNMTILNMLTVSLYDRHTLLFLYFWKYNTLFIYRAC